MSGAYNAVAPDYRTNKDFTRSLAHVLKKPFWFPCVPAVILKIFLGEMSGVLLKGSRVSSEKIISSGYNFMFPDLESALNDLYGKS
jgi:NAD dependent epimerase/dehydratase family enzyme